MRKFLFLSFIAGIVFADLVAQTEADSTIYLKGIHLMRAANTTEKYLQTALYFEKIAADHPDHWMANYYTALAYILAGQRALKGSKNQDELLDKAQPFIDKASALKNSEPENYILQAFLYQIRLLVDPQARVISLSQKAESNIKKAIEADSTNPRAYFLLANNIYYTPPVFKGGPKNALPVFLKARDKFKNYKFAMSFSPDWGQQQNEEMIQLCDSQKN